MKRVPDHQKLAKNRLVPYKILTMLLWHEYSWAVWESDTVVRIKSGPMARQMQLSNGKLRDHFDWLTVHGYFAEVSTDYGVALITLGHQKRGSVARIDDVGPGFLAQVDALMVEHKDVLDILAPKDTQEYHSKSEQRRIECLSQKPVDKPKAMW